MIVKLGKQLEIIMSLFCQNRKNIKSVIFQIIFLEKNNRQTTFLYVKSTMKGNLLF